MQGITKSLRALVVSLMLSIVATTSHALDATSMIEGALDATAGKDFGKDLEDLASNRPDGLVYVYCSLTGTHCKIGVSNRGKVVNRNKYVWTQNPGLFNESHVWMIQDLTRREAWAVEYLVHQELKLAGLWIDPTETKTLEGVELHSTEVFRIGSGLSIAAINANAALVRKYTRSTTSQRNVQDHWETRQDMVHIKNETHRDVTQSSLLWNGKYIGPKTTSIRESAAGEQDNDKAQGKCSHLNKIEIPGRHTALLELGVHLTRLGACKIAS